MAIHPCSLFLLGSSYRDPQIRFIQINEYKYPPPHTHTHAKNPHSQWNTTKPVGYTFIRWPRCNGICKKYVINEFARFLSSNIQMGQYMIFWYSARLPKYGCRWRLTPKFRTLSQLAWAFIRPYHTATFGPTYANGWKNIQYGVRDSVSERMLNGCVYIVCQKHMNIIRYLLMSNV